MQQTLNVASNAKLIEVLKAEFIGEAADVIRSLASQGGKQQLLDTLGGAVLLAYTLARRCGISFSELDDDIVKKAESGIKERHLLETGYKDLSSLIEHFESGTARGFGDKKGRV